MNLSKLYDRMNDEFFNSELCDNAHIIEIDQTSKGMKILERLGLNYYIDGFLTFDDVGWIIGIDKHLTKQDKFFTLAHEMVHIWQFQTGKNMMRHGKVFNRKCMKILDSIITGDYYV